MCWSKPGGSSSTPFPSHQLGIDSDHSNFFAYENEKPQQNSQFIPPKRWRKVLYQKIEFIPTAFFLSGLAWCWSFCYKNWPSSKTNKSPLKIYIFPGKYSQFAGKRRHSSKAAKINGSTASVRWNEPPQKKKLMYIYIFVFSIIIILVVEGPSLLGGPL